MIFPELTFHGAAGTVTGSCYELVWHDKRIIIDCGLFQGTRSLESLNHAPFNFMPRDIDAVILTHAHLDHSGRIPLLYAQGCKAPLFCTAPTADIIFPLLLDSAELQAHDATRRNRRLDRRFRPEFSPLYTSDDVKQCMHFVTRTNFCS
ncbi:MAG: MBL fold metallo-hydrolase, partial [Alphaproteobacteria bacterium]|nr:MBL fold metallo-hydrolase [Alphaproteobacteria bacterium]